MQEPFIVNISSVHRFQQCRLRWYFEWVLNRVPRENEQALTFGKMLHEIFERHFISALTMQEATDIVRKEYQSKIDPAFEAQNEKAVLSITDALDQLSAVEEALVQWHDVFIPEQTLAIEQPFEFPHPADPTIIVRGRPDREWVMQGKLFHVQNRSLAPSKNIGLYLELAKRDYHEHIYKWAMTQKYPDIPWGGVVMNILRKLKYRGVPTKKDPEGKILHEVDEILYQGIVTLSDQQTELALSDLLYDAKEMRRTIYEAKTTGKLPSPNRRLDAGPFGNKMDPWFPVFTGQVSVNDDAFFKDREDMYKPVTDSED